jgi:hypothetical protein
MMFEFLAKSAGDARELPLPHPKREFLPFDMRSRNMFWVSDYPLYLYRYYIARRVAAWCIVASTSRSGVTLYDDAATVIALQSSLDNPRV